jgi:CRP/FNR family transcriptional regulator
LTETRVFLIEKEAIAKVIQQNGMFGYTLIRRYSEQNTNLFEIIRTLNFKQMNGRMAETLIYLDKIGKENNFDLFSALSRKDIAEFAGISTESTVKILKSFEKDLLLKLDEKSIAISNPEMLMEISKRG